MTGAGTDPAEIFVDEALGRLDEMDAVLLAIESDPIGGGDADAIDTLFRDAHTIKGGAAMLGLPGIEAVAHAIEDVLAIARDNGAVPAGLEPALLRATADVRRLVTGEIDEADAVIAELAARRAELAGPVSRARSRRGHRHRMPPAATMTNSQPSLGRSGEAGRPGRCAFRRRKLTPCSIWSAKWSPTGAR